METRILWNLVKTWELINKPHNYKSSFTKEAKDIDLIRFIPIHFEPDFEYGFLFDDNERSRREVVRSLIKWGDLDFELK